MMDLCRLTSAAVDGPDGIKMVEIDFQALCRVCGALGENLTSVFGKRAADRLRERIARYLQIEILQEDCLPTKICDGCRETLDQFHELFDKCHRTDEKFRSMMSSAEELKETTEQERQPSSPDGKQRQQKKEARNSKIDSGVDADMKSLELEEEKVESGKQKKVPEETGKKNTKENKRKEEEDQDVAQETKGDDQLRHAIRVVGFSEYQESMHVELEEFLPAEEGEEIYSDYQFIEDEEEEAEAGEDGVVCFSAPTTDLNREIVDAARVVHKDGTVCYECTECGKKIRSPYTYQEHLRIHSGERPFQCTQCPRTFRISQGLARHVRDVHERRRTHACEICGDRFGNKRNLDEHRNRHTNERPYRCETCGSSYNQKAALLIHSRVHGAERNFVCGVCSKAFHTRTKLELHESTHSEERPFGCDQCELRFRNAHDLRRHSKNHSTDKQFQCGLCGGLFKQKRYLLKHLKTQHQQDQ